MKVYVVIDMIYGDEGNPGVRLFHTESEADAEEKRLLSNDPKDGTYLVCRDVCELKDEWSGSLDFNDPDNYWIDDKTGERVNAKTGERTKA